MSNSPQDPFLEELFKQAGLQPRPTARQRVKGGVRKTIGYFQRGNTLIRNRWNGSFGWRVSRKIEGVWNGMYGLTLINILSTVGIMLDRAQNWPWTPAWAIYAPMITWVVLFSWRLAVSLSENTRLSNFSTYPAQAGMWLLGQPWGPSLGQARPSWNWRSPIQSLQGLNDWRRLLMAIYTLTVLPSVGYFGLEARQWLDRAWYNLTLDQIGWWGILGFVPGVYVAYILAQHLFVPGMTLTHIKQVERKLLVRPYLPYYLFDGLLVDPIMRVFGGVKGFVGKTKRIWRLIVAGGILYFMGIPTLLLYVDVSLSRWDLSVVLAFYLVIYTAVLLLRWRDTGLLVTADGTLWAAESRFLKKPWLLVRGVEASVIDTKLIDVVRYEDIRDWPGFQPCANKISFSLRNEAGRVLVIKDMSLKDMSMVSEVATYGAAIKAAQADALKARAKAEVAKP